MLRFNKAFKEPAVCKENISLFCGWFIDGTGNSPQKNIILDIRKGKIASIKVHKYGESLPPDVADCSKYTIIPSLIDCHVHLAMSGTAEDTVRKNQLNASYDDAKKIILENIKDQLSNGIMAVREAGDRNGYVLDIISEKKKKGDIPLTVRLTGNAWHAEGRYGRFIGKSPGKGGDLACSLLKWIHDYDHIKVINSGINSLIDFGRSSTPQFSLDELKKAIRLGLEHGVSTMVHANGKIAVESSIRAGCCSIEHGFLMGRENMGLMAEKNVTWVPTIYTMKAYSDFLDPGSVESENAKRYLEDQMIQLNEAKKQGVTIGLGTDSGSLGVNHGIAVREEISMLLQAGFSIGEAIKCVTSNAAKLLVLDDILGSIKKGKPANFIIAKGRAENLPQILDSIKYVYFSKGQGSKYAFFKQKRQSDGE